jgi:L-threonylcarbamoyladenylate synthase
LNTLLLPASTGENILQAVAVLRRGGLVAFPTDTVYGLGALAFSEAAVLGIYEAKARPRDKSIPVLLSSAAEIDQVAARVGERARRLAHKFWPGPLTLVVPKNARVPDVVGRLTVGIRVPDHPVARALLELAGPLAVTSANISGRQSPITAAEVMQQMDGRVDIVLDGGLAFGGVPSTVVDCTSDELAMLRPGPLAFQELIAALE